MNEIYDESIEFTPIKINMNKKPKRALENWLSFSPSNSEINYERKLEMVKTFLEKE